MIVFEGRAFDEKNIWYINTLETNERVGKEYQPVTKLCIHMNIKNPLNGNEIIDIIFKNHETAISKINEITQLINKREEELLKLTNP